MAIITCDDVCECDQCGHEWLPERGKNSLPKQCPSRKCRSAKWNIRGVVENRVMPNSRHATDTSVGSAGTHEATVERTGANPVSPTKTQRPAEPVRELVTEKDDYSQ